MWPFYQGPHFCYFRKVRSHVDSEGVKWVERCRCGRSVTIDCNFFVRGCKTPKMIRTYFDANGNIERVTGSAINVLGRDGINLQQDYNDTKGIVDDK